MKAAVSLAQAINDAGERLARLPFGQCLGRQQRAQRLLDLQGLLGLGRDNRAARDGLVDSLLRLGLLSEIGDLLRALRRRLGHTLPQHLPGAGLGVDAVARRLD